MNEELLKTVFNAIPVNVLDIYLDNEIREEIAKQVVLKIDGDCNHEFKTISQVKIIEPSVCGKCGKVKSKMF
jgi:hypothetical protein